MSRSRHPLEDLSRAFSTLSYIEGLFTFSFQTFLPADTLLWCDGLCGFLLLGLAGQLLSSPWWKSLSGLVLVKHCY